MSFFKKHAPKIGSKRKHVEKKGKKKKSDSFFTSTTASKSKPKPMDDDEEDEIDSDEFDDDNIDTNDVLDNASDGEEETPQDKRLRLAKKYLEEIANEEKSRAEDNQDMLEHSITQRLNKDYLDSIGKLRRKIADTYCGYNPNGIRSIKHKLQKISITCFCLSSDEKYLFSGCKNSVIVKWELNDDGQTFSGKIDLQQINPNCRSSTVAIAISTDFKYLAIADGSKNIYIWCPESLKLIHTFDGHRDGVTGVIFRRDSHTLYSTSKDRSVKIWSLDEMAYVETLFGHQFPITSIDTLSKERVITSGGSDRSVRIWKISEESQLLFHGHKGNIEQVKLINEEHFLSSADDGSLCSWSVMRKKPLCTLELVHGTSSINNEGNWITAIATLLNTDICASGSCDGFIRLWKLGGNSRTIEKLFEIPVKGFINSLAFTSDGSKLIAGVGQEHRLGRWWTLKEARNCILIIPLLFK